ncbi:P2Y purinoceptor 13 isoform X3 [Aquila chrysaetos chrysaetos]|uniref:P2Y purinoceptor 13 isoform X3 n=1 Tax=Aquila chrysaetos chrysaetos TaxID=223781 RepID=UPI001B7D3280|nr:P2Y purinoceptor 13 isoform X3 [Aquila chrysaetos chrysaetos]
MGDFANKSIVSNSSGVPSSALCHRDTTVIQMVFPLLYTLVFLLGLVLNSLAFWAFFHIPSTSTFIVYLKNILVSDFIMTLMLPLKILTDSGLGPWQLKAFVCRFSAVVFYDTMYISIVLLGLIAFDRFLKIVRPFGKFWVQNLTAAKILAGLVWLFFFVLSLPNMILSNKKATPQSVKKCASLKNYFGLKWHEAVNYICQLIFWTVLILMLLFYIIIAKKGSLYSESNDHPNGLPYAEPALCCERKHSVAGCHKRLHGPPDIHVLVQTICRKGVMQESKDISENSSYKPKHRTGHTDDCY